MKRLEKIVDVVFWIWVPILLGYSAFLIWERL